MCGLNGIFAWHRAAGIPNESELVATRDAMRARGPDGCGVWWNENRRCGFGHRRLAILDLSDRALQPMASADGKLVVVFNGEIYNYPTLRAELEADGQCFRTTSDTEVLLYLYARYGFELVRRLRGMYAFAIWDQERAGLFLARDPYGIKPLYTANDGWTFRFASQVKALIAGGQISRDPEPAGVVGFHLLGSVPEPFTLYREIQALPAGHTQWVDSSGPREPKPFTTIAEILAEGARQSAMGVELQTLVRANVLDSVRVHLLADVPVGVFLSAGVDSGALLGLMRDVGQGEVCAITLAFDEYRGTSDDEVPFAANVAKQYQAKHVIRNISEREFDTDLSAIFAAMDQPSIDGVNTWFVAKAAKEAGLKVALSGLGGDELLAGYSSFVDIPRWLRRYGWLSMLPGFGRAIRGILRTMAPDLVRNRPKVLGLLEHSDSWAGAYLLRRGLFLPHELSDVLDVDMAREGVRRLQLKKRLAKSLVPDPECDVGRVCALESSFYMRNQLLRDADWAGMAHSVEIRLPFVDATLLKSIAPAMKQLVPGAGKGALASAPTRALPEQIRRRTKTGFTVPTNAWMAKAARTQVALIGAKPKGLVSRDWSHVVLAALNSPDPVGI